MFKESILEGNPASEQFAAKMEECAKGEEEGKRTEDYTFSPDAQDFLLENVDYNYLKRTCHNVWFAGDPDTLKYGYLETAEVLPKQLPVRGSILGLNRMWINLVCQAQRASVKDGKSQYGPARNITFFVALGSPYSYLSRQAMESLAPDMKPTPEKLDIQFHPAQLGVDQVYMSPASSHFSGANILGNNILKRSKQEVFINYRKDSFEILETAGDESEGGLK